MRFSVELIVGNFSTTFGNRFRADTSRGGKFASYNLRPISSELINCFSSTLAAFVFFRVQPSPRRLPLPIIISDPFSAY